MCMYKVIHTKQTQMEIVKQYVIVFFNIYIYIYMYIYIVSGKRSERFVPFLDVPCLLRFYLPFFLYVLFVKTDFV